MSSLIAAIDLGGTTVKCAALTEDGELLHRHRTPTPKTGREDVLRAICSSLGRLARELALSHNAGFSTVGLGSPGMIGSDGYLYGEAVNIPGWREFNLAEELSARIGLSVTALNDANAAALAELSVSTDSRTLALVTAGTGIGVGLAIDGRPHAGRAGAGGELGHLVIRPGGRRCTCGNVGCTEAYASARAVRELALEQAVEWSDATSGFAARLRAGGPESTEAEIFGSLYRAVREDDPFALEMHRDFCGVLAQVAAILASTIAPDRVLFGGGVMGSADLILPEVRRQFGYLVMPHVHQHVQIDAAKLGADAGLIGAAIAARRLP
ncbi:MAG: ROK family protein [Spirochaetaceae bacterium]